MKNPTLSTLTPTIVLIENDYVTLELYQRELCKSFTVFAFTELKGVLEVLANQDVRAVIIEPEICSRRGWELIHTIHETFPDRYIPVIVCSTRDITNTGPALEVTKYLTKPVLPGTLREKTLEIIREKENSRKKS
jgi:response regulator RpfG family c-di-GMP phosphodiesterase